MPERTSTHSGRYSRSTAKHNDRKFDLNKADNIDQERTSRNLYWTCYGKDVSFEEAEKKFYEETFKGMIEDINERAERERHPERKKSAEKLLKSKKTMPEEVIYEIGNKDDHASPEELTGVFHDFFRWHVQKYGSYVQMLDAALHLDEATPHIHVRQVWMYDNEKGFKAIGQNKALKQFGFEPPDPDRPIGRNNNLKMPYSADCRKKWIRLCREHGLEVEEIPKERPKSRQNQKTNDFIIGRQKEEMEENEKKIDSQEQKISGLEGEVQRLEDHIQDFTGRLKESTDLIEAGKFFAPAVIQQIPAKIKHGRVIDPAVTIVRTDDYNRLLRLAKTNSGLLSCAEALPKLKETGTKLLSVSRELIKPREEWMGECLDKIEDYKNQAIKELEYPQTDLVAFDDLDAMQKALDSNLVDPHEVYVKRQGCDPENYFHFYKNEKGICYFPDPDLETAVQNGKYRLYGYEELVPRGLLNALISILEEHKIALPEIISDFLGGNERINKLKKEIEKVQPIIERPSRIR